MKKISTLFLSAAMLLTLSCCGTKPKNENSTISESAETASAGGQTTVNEVINMSENINYISEIPENFVLIEGGTFEMGSPDTEAWRSEDETRHTVTVSDFCMSIYEVTQAEYSKVMGSAIQAILKAISCLWKTCLGLTLFVTVTHAAKRRI